MEKTTHINRILVVGQKIGFNIVKKLHIKIGEHLIEIISNSFKLTNIFKNHFQSITVLQDAIPDLHIQLEEEYGVPFVDYEVQIIKELNNIYFRRADFFIEADHEYKHATIKVHDELALKHALMTLYSSFIVYHNWGLLIHSSCVNEAGRAHIFAGHSGAGKSTAARLSYPRQLLSDEATIVKITPQEIVILDSPFRSELEAPCLEQAIPLSSIHILIQALQNKRIQLKKSDAYVHLINKVFYWTNYDDEAKKIFGLIMLLITKTPVYELHFQKNNTFWELIS